jgi:hypothetical protein
MPVIELIYDSDCPNLEETRTQLVEACARAGVKPKWCEWDRSSRDSPLHLQHYGSPTVLVNGQDVAGLPPAAGGPCCRLYLSDKGIVRPSPTVEAIVAALSQSKEPEAASTRLAKRSDWRSSLGVLPGLGIALLPKLACPACWPAYAGLLSALGLNFLIEVRHLFLVTSVFLLFAVGALGFRAKLRQGYGPFLTGATAAVLVLLGKFTIGSEPVTYVGLGLLLVASLWNCWRPKFGQHSLHNGGNDNDSETSN